MRHAIAFLFAAVLFLGCNPDNLLDGNTDQPLGTGAGNLPPVAAVVPGVAGLLADDNPDMAGVQATVEIRFADYMDPATLVAANVRVLNTATGDVVTGLSLTGNAEARRLYVRHEDWSGGSEYLLTLSGVESRYGSPLDGNGNGRADGAPYDDFLTTFYVTGGNPANCVPTVPPAIAAALPDTVRIADFKPEMRITFSTAMDTTTLRNSDGSVKNLQLAPEGGNTLPLDLLSLTPQVLSVTPRESLIAGRKYVVTLATAQVRADYRAHTPEYLEVLDAKGDGAQAEEPPFTWYFALDTLVPPQVSSAGEIADGVRIEFSALMDTLTLGPGVVQVFDEDGYVPGNAHFSRTAGNATRVEYYFAREPGQRLRVFVSRLAGSADGLMLDTNGNGIGGEPEDDYNRTL
ncbi:hypothetical protein FJY71_02590 [candidate division WOR-3 bacterium]|nr:hypothetical protein [candidate division WOR-3 bacterium]